MARWYRLSLMAFTGVWGCSNSSSLEGQLVDGKGAQMAKVKMIAKQVQPIKGYEQFETPRAGTANLPLRACSPTRFTGTFLIGKIRLAWCGSEWKAGSKGHTKMMPEPVKIRFTRAKYGVISDSATGLEWYEGSDRDTNWKQAKSWTGSLTIAGVGWRMATIPELKTLY